MEIVAVSWRQPVYTVPRENTINVQQLLSHKPREGHLPIIYKDHADNTNLAIDQFRIMVYDKQLKYITNCLCIRIGLNIP